MTDYLITLKVKAEDAASKPLKEIEKALGSIGGAAFLGGVTAAAAAVTAFAGALKVGVDEAMEWQDGIAQMEAGLKSTAGVAGVTKQMILDLADSMQQETKFSDDAILSASNLALTFTGINKDIFPDVIRLSADMATRLKMDLNSALMMVAKGMQDEVGGVTAMRRAGVMFNDQQEATIKALVETGDHLSAQRMILGELSTEFAGSAKAAAATFGGQMTIIGNQARDFAQLLGDPVIPVLQEVAAELLLAFKDPATKAAISDMGKDIADMARKGIAIVKELKTEMGSIGGALQANQGTIINVGELAVAAFAGTKILSLMGSIQTGAIGYQMALLGMAVSGQTLAGALGMVATAASSAILALGPLALVTAGLFGAYNIAQEAARAKSAADRIQAIEPDNPAMNMWTSTATTVGKAEEMMASSAMMTTDALETLATQLEEKAAKESYFASIVETSAGAWIMAEDAVREGGVSVGTALGDVSKLMKAWTEYNATAAGAMLAIGVNQSMGAGDVGFGGGIAGGRNGIPTRTDSFSKMLQDFLLGDVSSSNKLFAAKNYAAANPGFGGAQDYYKSLLGGGAAGGLSMSMPDVLARAFPNIGAAQGWMGAFQSAQGREAGVTDVRDKMAGDLFAQKYGRAATDEEWQTRWKEGSFKGVDEKGAGLDAMFGKPGTWKTLVDEKGKQEAEETKKLLDAFAAQKATADTGNTILASILEKITPAGGTPPPPPGGTDDRYYSNESKHGG